MRSLQVRLTVWFAVSFVAVAAVFAGLTYHHIEQQLSRTAFAREQNLNRDWVIRGSVSEQEIDQIMTTIVGSSLKFILPLVFALLLLGYWLARKSLEPLETPSTANWRPSVSAILSLRVGLPAADSQFRDLTQRLNEMLERLERSFGEMGRIRRQGRARATDAPDHPAAQGRAVRGPHRPGPGRGAAIGTAPPHARGSNSRS